MANQLRILQWNCQSLRTKRAELEKRSLNYEVMLLSETWISANENLIFRNFDVINIGRKDRRGGVVALLMGSGIRYKIINNLYNVGNKLEICAAEISLKNKPVTIVSAYKPPHISISVLEWENFFSQFTSDTIIGGDSHHTSWSNSLSCSEGNKLFQAQTNLGFSCLNNGSHTRIPTPHQCGSAIDLTFTNSDIFITAHWEVIQETWGSDLPINIEIQGSAVSRMRFSASHKIHSVKTDWSKVLSSLNEVSELSNSIASNDELDIQVRYSSFMAIIERCVKEHTPTKKNPTATDRDALYQHKSSPWWNDECERLARLRKAALQRYKFCQSRTNFIKYRQANAVAKKTFRLIKRDYFLKFCNALGRTSNMKYVWHKVRAMNNSFHRKETPNAYTEETALIVNDLIAELSPP